jgi:uncharacterized protein
MYALNVIAMVLLIIGGLNWGLVGLANYNAIERIFYAAPVIAKIIYILAGLAAIYAIVFFNWFVRPYEQPEPEMGEHRPHTPHLT